MSCLIVGFVSFVDLGDAGVHLAGGRETALEVRVQRGSGKLGSERTCVLETCAMAAGVVDEFINGSLAAVGIVAGVVSN